MDDTALNLLDTTLNKIDRRSVLHVGLAGLLASIVPVSLIGNAANASTRSWRLNIKHAHTSETFSGVYRVGNKYLPEAFERLNYIMRDHRTHEAFPMDPRVIDIISQVQRNAASREPLNILSGYRSTKTNAMLRGKSSGVAKNSYHMYGQALDVRIPGVKTSSLRKIALNLKAGGVGYYPRSGFIHVDTGDIRSWS